MPKTITVKKKRKARRKPTQHTNNAKAVATNVVVIQNQQKRKTRNPSTKQPPKQEVPAVVHVVSHQKGSEDPRVLRPSEAVKPSDIVAQIKNLVQSGLVAQNSLMENALRKNSELLQNDIAKKTYQTPEGDMSYSPNPILTPATKTLMGIDDIKEYLKRYKEDIPMGKRYKDSDIEGLQANQLLKLYEATKRQVEHYRDEEETPPSITKLKRMLEAAEEQYYRDIQPSEGEPKQLFMQS